jgi:hypothetical protein
MESSISDSIKSTTVYLDTLKFLVSIADKFGVSQELIDQDTLTLKFKYQGKRLKFSIAYHDRAKAKLSFSINGTFICCYSTYYSLDSNFEDMVVKTLTYVESPFFQQMRNWLYE